jgi:hypothetical protein
LNSSGSILAVNASLALDDSGQAVVGLVELTPSGTEQRVYVKRNDGVSWLPLGGGPVNININLNASNPSVALDSSGNPAVAWDECFTSFCTDKDIYVKRWNGTSWVQLGSFLDFDSFRLSTNPSLALDSSGNPVVSWQESDGTSSNIYVKRWNGSAWVLVGTTFLDVNTNRDASKPSLALDSSGNPVIAWHEHDGTSTKIYVKKYITNSWQDMGGMLDVAGGQSATNSSIARKSNNNPVVAWDETDSNNGSRNVYVKEWNGTNWIRRGGTLDKVLGADAENPSVATRATGANIHVAWQENGNIYESLWSGGASFVTQGSANSGALDNNLASEAITPSLAVRSDNFPVVAFAEDGNIIVKRLSEIFWIPIGAGFLDTILANEAYKPSLALKTDDNPIVAWYEDNGTSFDIFVKEWDGGAWASLGGAVDKTLSKDAKDIALAIRSDNRPVVAWEEDGNIYVKRWTGTSWASVGGTLDKTAGNEALRPSIDLRSDNNPVVTWQEWNGSSYDVWVKRWTGSTWALIANAADKNPS